MTSAEKGALGRLGKLRLGCQNAQVLLKLEKVNVRLELKERVGRFIEGATLAHPIPTDNTHTIHPPTGHAHTKALFLKPQPCLPLQRHWGCKSPSLFEAEIGEPHSVIHARPFALWPSLCDVHTSPHSHTSTRPPTNPLPAQHTHTHHSLRRAWLVGPGASNPNPNPRHHHPRGSSSSNTIGQRGSSHPKHLKPCRC